MKKYHNTGVGMGLPYRPLGMVKAMLETIGIEITYSYEDLIFIQHNHFLLQFGKSGELLLFHTNVETSTEEAAKLFSSIQAVAAAAGFTLLLCGRYRLTPADGENLSLEFLEE